MPDDTEVLKQPAERTSEEYPEEPGDMATRIRQAAWEPTLGSAAFFLIWGSGWVFAQGFWSTFWSVVFPPWALYLFLERVYFMLGMIR